MSQAESPKRRPVQIHRPANLPSYYVEGVSQMLLGFPISRLQLNGMADRPADPALPETHHLAVELVMPTPAIVEMCLLLLEQINAVRPQLEADRPAWLAAVDQVYQRLAETMAKSPPAPASTGA